MEDKHIKDPQKGIKTKESEKQYLEFCSTAPSAEHFRGKSDDEPCDDGRSGK